ncbi:TadE/TadG family type IV pilus assembly protein [Streptomyces sp. NBC_01803]|uniref:TadE/TadG family type IV pilus assembly protein n=1 Tax=Streptomyces sp. NBC_01803 TaxID=2975946 RepID=UPI002DDA12A4|nr:TadE/TadG family type IV pilus assembly protein [Streptomyces sp. NBC_01803]WSA44207.1 pilus assembly protein [Streptomyces sp. NBC_01803]
MNETDDRGAASTQLVLVTPLVLLLMLLCAQFALAWHAQHIAQTAATHGLADARALDGNERAGADTARAALRSAGGRVLSDPEVRVRRDATSASVDIDGTVLPLIPGLHLAVSGHAEGPVERFTTAAGDSDE